MPFSLTEPMAHDELHAEFEALQKKLVPMWQIIGGSAPADAPHENNTVVVVPSFPPELNMAGSEQQAYEERMLFLLFLLRQPSLHLIYVTSLTVQPEIIDYYLSTLPGVVITNARRRLHLISPHDGSAGSLSEKILARPPLIKQIRDLIPDPERAHLVPYTTTDAERELAVRLGIPMYAADPRFWAFGTKSGCRRIFAEEGLPHPIGFENLSSVNAMVEAIAKLRAQKPHMQSVIAKLNQGVSGEGNALIDLANLPTPGSADEAAAIEGRVANMQLEDKTQTYAKYAGLIESNGAIVEERIVGEEVRSPSAQLRVTPTGVVELLSTHDQLLGGPSGQSYLGAAFPADLDYAWTIMREAKKVGDRFAKEGIVGRFALDFIAVRSANQPWEVYAIEVNLRKGGTTAPFLILQYLTDGKYDPEAGTFLTRQGHERNYVSSDHVEDHRYCVFDPLALFDILTRYQLHFNHARQTGCVMHMVSSVSELGRVGVTCIGETAEDAQKLYERFQTVLENEAEKALQVI